MKASISSKNYRISNPDSIIVAERPNGSLLCETSAMTHLNEEQAQLFYSRELNVKGDLTVAQLVAMDDERNATTSTIWTHAEAASYLNDARYGISHFKEMPNVLLAMVERGWIEEVAENASA